MLIKFGKGTSRIALMSVLGVFCSGGADALSQRVGDFDFRLNGYGTAGFLETEKPEFLGDFSIRAQALYNANNAHTFGLMYVMDATALDEKEWFHQAFGFWQWRGVGRIEAGFTESVAHKLGLGLPDVGGLKINENSWIYKKIGADGPVIANSILTCGHDALRVNVVSASNSRSQYGFSVSGLSDEYDIGFDVGLKLKQSAGKVKTAISFGGSFMNDLDNYSADTFTPGTTADWRAQFATGLNIQYNSWIFGINARAIYDENPVGVVTDGIAAGTGLSYDLLNYTLSLSYILSDTGIWHQDTKEYVDNTVVASFRYKYTRFVDVWSSLGITRHEPFVSAGLRLTF
ncbi:MAG: hypothetical protein K5912_03410 [Alphaproteobacteria bacterium]|nr:hypothetical protein [Alphaproteobacteria bacterium]